MSLTQDFRGQESLNSRVTTSGVRQALSFLFFKHLGNLREPSGLSVIKQKGEYTWVWGPGGYEGTQREDTAWISSPVLKFPLQLSKV